MRKAIKTGIFISLVFSAGGFANDKPKNVYKLTHLSANEAIVTCQNGADPTIKNITPNALLVSCGASIKASWDGTQKKFVCPKGLFVWPDEKEGPVSKDDFVYCGTYPLTN